MSTPFEVPQWADISDFVEEVNTARKSMDELAASTGKMAQDVGGGTEKTVKTTKSLGGFISQLKKAAPQIALVATVAPTIMDFIGGLTEPFETIGEAVTELGLTASEGFVDMAEDITDSIYSLQPIAENMGTWIGDMYSDIQAQDWDGLSENVESGLSSAWENVVSFFEGDTLNDIAEAGAAVVNGIADFLLETTPGEWKIIWDGITDALTTFFVDVRWDLVFLGITKAFFDIGSVLLDAFWDGVNTWWEENWPTGNSFFEDFAAGYGGFG